MRQMRRVFRVSDRHFTRRRNHKAAGIITGGFVVVSLRRFLLTWGLHPGGVRSPGAKPVRPVRWGGMVRPPPDCSCPSLLSFRSAGGQTDLLPIDRPCVPCHASPAPRRANPGFRRRLKSASLRASLPLLPTPRRQLSRCLWCTIRSRGPGSSAT